MEACWASTLGNCSDRLSREHLVSNSLFLNDKISVQGFSWCKDQPKEIGISGLTSKILCAHHNSILSPVDTAGADAFSELREMRRVANIRQAFKPQPWTVIQRKIDGLGLERWFLKTLINLSYEREYPIGRDSSAVGRPTDDLVKIVYGTERFKERAGLYSVIHVGMKLNSSERVGFAPLIKDLHHIEGGLFAFRGFVFLLFLEADGPPPLLTGISFDGIDLSHSQLNFHNQKAIEMNGKYRSQVLTTTW